MTTDISVGVRWDPIGNQDVIEDYEFEYDGGNSSSRLFERSRIKALAGMCFFFSWVYISIQWFAKFLLGFHYDNVCRIIVKYLKQMKYSNGFICISVEVTKLSFFTWFAISLFKSCIIQKVYFTFTSYTWMFRIVIMKKRLVLNSILQIEWIF